MSTNVLTLPYPEITSTANRDAIRSNQKHGRTTYYVQHSNIVIRPLFNVRQKPSYMTEEEWFTSLQIKELADGLLAGKESPEIIKGDFSEDGCKFILSDGYRRYLAIRYLMEQGHTHYQNGRLIAEVEVLPNPKDFTEQDRIRQMFTTNHNLKLSHTQNADLVWRLKHYFELTSEQVAQSIGGVSRQWVDNMLLLHSADDKLKALLDKGEITLTDALKGLREDKKQAKEASNRQEVQADLLAMVDTGTGEIIETQKSLEEEIKSRKTDGSFKAPKEKNGNDLPGKDWSKEQEECIFKLNGSIGNSDKVSVRISKLGINAQDKADLERLLGFMAKDLAEVRDVLFKVKFKD